VILTVGGVVSTVLLATFTVILAGVVLPAASRATAVRVYVPLVTVRESQVTL
jgi:hypothetical protein